MIYNVGVTIIEIFVLPITKPYYSWFHLKNPTESAKQIHNVQISHNSFVYDARTIDTSNADIIPSSVCLLNLVDLLVSKSHH